MLQVLCPNYEHKEKLVKIIHKVKLLIAFFIQQNDKEVNVSIIKYKIISISNFKFFIFYSSFIIDITIWIEFHILH